MQINGSLRFRAYRFTGLVVRGLAEVDENVRPLSDLLR